MVSFSRILIFIKQIHSHHAERVEKTQLQSVELVRGNCVVDFVGTSNLNDILCDSDSFDVEIFNFFYVEFNVWFDFCFACLLFLQFLTFWAIR